MPSSSQRIWPTVGCGVGLRPPHYPVVLGEKPSVDWFEVVTENYLDTAGRPLHVLERVRKDYPIALHGVALSIGSMDPLDLAYLKKLRELVSRIQPAMVSDHLCWTGVAGENLHDLLPLPHTEEVISHVVARVRRTQEILGRRILLENPSSYIQFTHSEMPEWQFLSEVAERADCGILLDINNVVVNAFNHGFDASQYIQEIPVDRVGQFHLAGYTDMGNYYFDTHDEPVPGNVWDLYRQAVQRFGNVTTLIEWDAKIPEFQVLAEEARRARQIQEEAGYGQEAPIAISA